MHLIKTLFILVLISTPHLYAGNGILEREDFSSYSSTSDPNFLNCWHGYWTESIPGGLSGIATLVSGGLKLENTSNSGWSGMRYDLQDTDMSYLFNVSLTPSNTTNRFVVGIRKFGPSSTSYQVAVTFANGTIYAEDNGSDVAVGSYQANSNIYLSIRRVRDKPSEWRLVVNGREVGPFGCAYSGDSGRHVVFFDHGGFNGSATIHEVTWLPVLVTGN